VSEKVQIVIAESREGTAVEEEQQRIERLHAAANADEKKGGRYDATAAQTGRAEAMQLQKKQHAGKLAQAANERAAGNGDAADAAEREAKHMERTMELQRKGMGYGQARETAGKQLAQEAESAALKKAGIEKMGYTRARQEALTLSRELMTGAPTGRTISALLGNLMAGLAPNALMAMGAIAAPLALAGGAFLYNRDQGEKDYQEQRRFKEREGTDEFSREIEASPLGSSSEAFQKELADKKEIHDRTAHQETLQHDIGYAGFGMSKFLSDAAKGAGLNSKTPEERAAEENKDDIQAAKDDLAKQPAIKAAQWKLGGEIDEQILGDISEHSVDGLKKATYDTARKKWIDAYRKVWSETGNDAEGQKVADMTVKQDEWEKQMHRGASLVNARTGTAGTAAAARWASMKDVDTHRLLGQMHQEVKNLRTDINAANGQIDMSDQ